MLLRGCPWEMMHKWVTEKLPVVHVQIANMAFVLVGSAEGVKRVFQTGTKSSSLSLLDTAIAKIEAICFQTLCSKTASGLTFKLLQVRGSL